MANHLNDHQIKNSEELFNKINGIELNNDRHVLVTWDYESMFINIPFEKTKNIIRQFYHLIERETSIPVDVFLDTLSFLIESCSYFTFENEIYRQTKDLTMGNCLSQILAEITS